MLITVLAVVFFCIEFIIFNVFTSVYKPHLMILLIIFFDLYLGIRYGLYAAVLAGLLADSYSTGIFGLNIVVYILCAYMTSILRKYIYYRGSRLSRLLLVLLISLIEFAARVVLHAIAGQLDFLGAVTTAYLPALCVTLLITTSVFQQLRLCASRSFV
jgi:rod shape-determining protein MreD